MAGATSYTSLDYAGGLAPPADPGPPAALRKRFAEDFNAFPFPLRWLDDLRSWGDGGRWLPVGAAAGTPSDRRGGKDLPLFWSELDLRAFRVNARYLADFNPFMIGFLGALVGYHVRKGYGWQCCLRGVRKTPYPTSLTPADPAVAKGQAVLDAWRDAVKWPLASREAFRRWRRDGEVFGRFGYGGWGRLPWFRFLGPEQVGSPTGDTTGPGSFGIETEPGDHAGPPLAYFVWDADEPGVGDWTPAGRVVHAKANVDADVKRGVPDSLPLHQHLDGARVLLNNMLTTAADQAAVAWLEQFPTATAQQVQAIIPAFSPPPAPGPGTNIPWWLSDGRGGTVNRFRAGSVIRVEGNRQFGPAPYSAGVPNYIEVEQAALRAACVRWNFPEYMTAKANDVNFAAALTTGSPFSVSIEGGQLEWGAVWERPCALKVLELARDAGLLTWEEWRRLDVEVTEPAVVTPEPDKDANRITGLVEARLLSPQTAQLQLQLDPQHEAENWKVWSAQNEPAIPAAKPEQPPAPPPAPALESVLLEHGFTGTDRLGRRWVDGKEVPKDRPADTGKPVKPGVPDAAHTLTAVLPDLAAEFPAEAKDPTVWDRVKAAAAKLRDAVYGVLVRATPYYLSVAEAVLDTPADLQKLGYVPTVTGPVAAGDAAAHADPIRQATGLSTHLVLSLTSKVLAAGFVWAKGKLAAGESAEPVEAAADWIAELLTAAAGALGLEATVDKAAVLAAVKAVSAR